MLESAKVRIVRLLRWSERYTRLDMVYVASGSFWQTLGQLCSSALALGLVLIFANFLPKETYGTYRYLISLAGMLNVFTLTGMNQAVGQAVANGRDGVLRASVRYQIKWNSFLMIASLAIAGYYLYHGNLIYTGGLLVLALCVPLTNAFTTYSAFLTNKREFRLNNLFSVLSTFIYVTGMSATIFLSGQVVWLVAAYALTSLASSALFYAAVLRRFNTPDESSEAAHDVFRYGRHLTYINLMAPVVGQLDSVLLNQFWGPANLAVYSIAMTVPNRTVPFIKSWVDLSSPKLAIKPIEEINRVFYRRIAQGFLVGFFFAASYVFFAPYVFTYLLPQYLDALFYTRLLAISFVFAMPTRYLSILFAARRLARPILISNLIQNALSILLYLALGIRGGILGLVVAQMIVSLNGFAVNFALWQWAKKRV